MAVLASTSCERMTSILELKICGIVVMACFCWSNCFARLYTWLKNKNEEKERFIGDFYVLIISLLKQILKKNCGYQNVTHSWTSKYFHNGPKIRTFYFVELYRKFSQLYGTPNVNFQMVPMVLMVTIVPISTQLVEKYEHILWKIPYKYEIEVFVQLNFSTESENVEMESK